ncbi:membrane protein [Mycobacterium rhizamassiliense]|jgi:hypothetical protein|uniref:Membrane protein n=1 Tax=Mycobacterium rhizamassiliense TaxID=1841860 RepID=A0A2U3NXE0_9MYCO|nr:hypothetical protein [Mycobacterium rhizamassiliense]SPM36177.1 membrane protein [Mycobacterium rhizamassiliense]
MTTPHPASHRLPDPPDDDGIWDAFTVRLPRWRFTRLFSLNPLVRWSDRVEALVVVLAMAIALAAVPIAAAVGTSVYDSRSHLYAEQAQNSHVVPATITDHKVVHRESLGPMVTVIGEWSAAGNEHTGPVSAPPGVKTGDAIDIWVDRDGSHVGPPPRTAYDEAVAFASLTWLGLTAAAGVLVAGTRAALNRTRHARWQDDFDNLTGNCDGRTNRP